MILVKDLVPEDSGKLYRYEKVNADGTGTGEYIFLKYAPGTLAQAATAVNRVLFEDLYGYANETITKSGNIITKVCGGITETTVKNSNGTIVTTKTDGINTVKRTITKSGNVITKVVS